MFIKVTLACSLFLFGCAQHRASMPAANINLSGFSGEFKEGYADGCASTTGAMQRDSSRFAANGAYSQGWRDGYSICRR